MKLEKSPNTTIIIKDKKYLYFSGTSYLGISNLPEFQEIIFKNFKKWGTSYGSSRLANVKLDIYESSEKIVSNFIKSEACVTVSSGTLSGLITLSVLEKNVDSFFFMPKTHPSILPNNALPVFVDDNLNKLLVNNKKETICIVVDALATLETKPYCFNFLQEISQNKIVYLLIDESHSLGVLGENGCGISSEIQTPKNVEIIAVSSFTKAFGVNGGLITGKKYFINLIKQSPLFIGSAPMNPAFLESYIVASSIYKNQLKTLLKNCEYVFDRIQHLDKVRMSKNYPVFFVDDKNIADFLLTKNIVITNFYYPTSSEKINRIVLNASHSRAQLDKLCNCILQFFK